MGGTFFLEAAALQLETFYHERCWADVGAAPSSMRAATARAGTMNYEFAMVSS